MQNDLLDPFLFEKTPIRGSLVHLGSTYHLALEHQHLPPIIKKSLGELMAACALLTSTLKMDGSMVFQIQTNGQLKLLVVECNANLEIRATAKWDGDIDEGADFLDIIKEGHCMITLDTKNNKPYQSIVSIEGNSIAAMLEHYMVHSQQIDTKLWLSCDGDKAAGLLIQKLPEQASQDADAWNRIGILAGTITKNELLTETTDRIITNLFHEEDVRLFDAKPVRFYCKCTRESVASMLQMLGKSEVESILAEQERIEVNCDYCNKLYAFDAVDAAALFISKNALSTSKAIH